MAKVSDPSAVLLTPTLAAARISLSVPSLYTLVRQGRIRAKRLAVTGGGPGQLMFRPVDLQAFVDALPETGDYRDGGADVERTVDLAASR